MKEKYNVTFFVQRVVKNTSNDMVKRYYGEADKFLIVNKEISVGKVRDLVSSLDE